MPLKIKLNWARAQQESTMYRLGANTSVRICGRFIAIICLMYQTMWVDWRDNRQYVRSDGARHSNQMNRQAVLETMEVTT
jgi:hypothetical protein